MTKDEALRLALEALKEITLEHGMTEKARTAIKAALKAKDEKNGSPCPEFCDWLPKAYQNGDADDLPKFTKYNMEVAFLAGKQSVALEAKGEPVAAECKFDQEKEWGRCSVEHHNLVQSEPHKWPGYQTRLLYTTQPQQEKKDEPVAWMYPDDLKRFETSETFAQAYSIEVVSPTHGETVPLYTTPPQRTWVKLTDEQYLKACQMAEGGNYMVAFQRIQQWLMENNA